MQERRTPDAKRPKREVLRRVPPNEEVVTAVEEKTGDLPRPGTGNDFVPDAVRFAPGRLPAQEKACGEENSRQPGINKRMPPIALLREPAANGEPDGRAERNRHIKKGQRGVAAGRGKEVRNPARAHGDKAGLPHPDEN